MDYKRTLGNSGGQGMCLGSCLCWCFHWYIKTHWTLHFKFVPSFVCHCTSMKLWIKHRVIILSRVPSRLNISVLIFIEACGAVGGPCSWSHCWSLHEYQVSCALNKGPRDVQAWGSWKTLVPTGWQLLSWPYYHQVNPNETTTINIPRKTNDHLFYLCHIILNHHITSVYHLSLL